MQIISAECIRTAWCYVFILSFIQRSCEKNKVSVTSVFNIIELDHLSKLMPKPKEYTTFVFLLGVIWFSCPTHDMISGISCCNIVEPKSIARLSGSGSKQQARHGN